MTWDQELLHELQEDWPGSRLAQGSLGGSEPKKRLLRMLIAVPDDDGSAAAHSEVSTEDTGPNRRPQGEYVIGSHFCFSFLLPPPSLLF